MFCGSGTICIEAAAIGLSRAPGLLRDFAFSSFSNADGAAALERAKEEARQKEKRDLKLRICGFDVSPDAVSLARFHLKAAGLEGAVHFQVGDMRNFSSRFAHGVAITNPPYGERLCDRKELKNLYRDFGNMRQIRGVVRAQGGQSEKAVQLRAGMRFLFFSRKASSDKKRVETQRRGLRAKQKIVLVALFKDLCF